MASQDKNKKRRLPAWMKAVHDKKLTVETENDVSDNSKQLKKEGDKGNAAFYSEEKKPSQAPDSVSAASDVITNAMPFVTFPGTVYYINSFSDCACFCEELLEIVSKAEDSKETEKTPIGFDMEWPVSFTRGKSDKTALVQMCFSDKKCYLFHVSAIGRFPKLLGDLITNEQIVLVGLNIEADLWKLERDFDIRVKQLIDRGSVVDVGKMANKVLKSSERWDLNGLCKNVLRKRLNKDDNIRCGSWADVPLSQTQRDYAVADAYAGLQLYQVLSSSEPLSKLCR